jgi:hypothetical protein
VEECVEKMHQKEEDRILAQRGTLLASLLRVFAYVLGLAAINLEAKSDDDVLELMVHRYSLSLMFFLGLFCLLLSSYVLSFI